MYPTIIPIAVLHQTPMLIAHIPLTCTVNKFDEMDSIAHSNDTIRHAGVVLPLYIESIPSAR